jgi:hypothetical protein
MPAMSKLPEAGTAAWALIMVEEEEHIRSSSQIHFKFA